VAYEVHASHLPCHFLGLKSCKISSRCNEAHFDEESTLKMQKRVLQFSLAIQSYSWLASYASAPPTLALGSIRFEYPGVLSLNEHVMLVS
jgi:hypothetical protein